MVIRSVLNGDWRLQREAQVWLPGAVSGGAWRLIAADGSVWRFRFASSALAFVVRCDGVTAERLEARQPVVVSGILNDSGVDSRVWRSLPWQHGVTGIDGVGKCSACGKCRGCHVWRGGCACVELQRFSGLVPGV